MYCCEQILSSLIAAYIRDFTKVGSRILEQRITGVYSQTKSTSYFENRLWPLNALGMIIRGRILLALNKLNSLWIKESWKNVTPTRLKLASTKLTGRAKNSVLELLPFSYRDTHPGMVDFSTHFQLFSEAIINRKTHNTKLWYCLSYNTKFYSFFEPWHGFVSKKIEFMLNQSISKSCHQSFYVQLAKWLFTYTKKCLFLKKKAQKDKKTHEDLSLLFFFS